MRLRKLSTAIMVINMLSNAAMVYPTPAARVAVYGAFGHKHWDLLALKPGASHILTPLRGFQDANYGVSGNLLAVVLSNKTGCILRTYSLTSGRALETVPVPGLRVAVMKEGPVRGVAIAGQRAVFLAGTGINLLGRQFVVMVNLKTRSVSRFPPPRGLQLSDYSAAVPGGLAWRTGVGRVAIFSAEHAMFRLVGGTRVNSAWLVYAPSYGLVAWNLRGAFQRLTDSRLQRIRSRVRQLPGHVMLFGMQAARIGHRTSLIYYADRSGAAGGKPRKPTTIISAYDLALDRLEWRVRFDFRAGAWFGASPHGRTICLADNANHGAVLYSVRLGRLFRTLLPHARLYYFRVLSVR